LPKQRGQRVEIEILRRPDADEAAAVAAEAMLCFLIQGKDSLRVGQEDFAMLGQPDAARIAHDQARTDLIFKTFNVETHRRLGEIHLARSLGKASQIAAKVRNSTVS
jgi:hypothetical protein